MRFAVRNKRPSHGDTARHLLRSLIRPMGYLLLIIVPGYYLMSPENRPVYVRGVIYLLWIFSLFRVMLYVRAVLPLALDVGPDSDSERPWLPRVYLELREKVYGSLASSDYFRHILAPRIARAAGIRVERDRVGRERISGAGARRLFGARLARKMTGMERGFWSRKIGLKDIQEMVGRVEDEHNS